MSKTIVPIEKQRMCTLTLTENCNLSCLYCYEHHKSNKIMPKELAISLAEQELCADNDYELVRFQFFGGEPLLEFETIRALVEHVKQHTYPKRYRFDATTNGTVLTDEMKDWFIDNKDIMDCYLSLDGTKQMHDINRCNSFDAIDLDFFRKNFPDCTVKMTVSHKTLPSLYEGVKFCYEKGFKVFWNLAYGIDWSNEHNKEILSEQLMKLIEFHLEHPEYEPSAMLGDPIVKVAQLEAGAYVQTWCATGQQMIAYSVDGKKYPCQFFSPVTAGDKAIELGGIKISKQIAEKELDAKCQSCVIRSVCPTCYGSNYYATGNLYKKDPNMCELMKIILKARSYYFALKWQRGELHMSELEEKATLKAITIIQKQL